MQIILFKIALDVGVHVGLLADERPALQFLGPHAAGAVGLVVGRGDADQRIIVERLKIQVTRAGIGEESKFHCAALEPIHDVGVGPLVQLHVDPGKLLLKRRHQLWHPGDAGRVEHPQPQHALVHAVDLGDGLAEQLTAVEHLADGRQQAFGSSGHGYAAFGAGEQQKPALRLHAGDRVADGRGR